MCIRIRAHETRLEQRHLVESATLHRHLVRLEFGRHFLFLWQLGVEIIKSSALEGPRARKRFLYWKTIDMLSCLKAYVCPMAAGRSVSLPQIDRIRTDGRSASDDYDVKSREIPHKLKGLSSPNQNLSILERHCKSFHIHQFHRDIYQLSTFEHKLRTCVPYSCLKLSFMATL